MNDTSPPRTPSLAVSGRDRERGATMPDLQRLSDGETRIRTGDTTIFSGEAAEPEATRFGRAFRGTYRRLRGSRRSRGPTRCAERTQRACYAVRHEDRYSS